MLRLCKGMGNLELVLKYILMQSNSVPCHCVI